MTIKVSAQELNDKIDWVYHCRASVQSCRDWEVMAELLTLLAAVEKLAPLELKRYNSMHLIRKHKAMLAAKETAEANRARYKPLVAA